TKYAIQYTINYIKVYYVHKETQMKKEDIKMKHELQEVREQLYNCINKDGICEEPKLIDINNRLDELILQWMKNSKKEKSLKQFHDKIIK
ncbi:MAG: hypothetical protein ACYDG2_08515, partial [Ruminiclostridium sp.]